MATSETYVGVWPPSKSPRVVSPHVPPGVTWPLLTAACRAEQQKMIMVTNFTSSGRLQSFEGKPGQRVA